MEKQSYFKTSYIIQALFLAGISLALLIMQPIKAAQAGQGEQGLKAETACVKNSRLAYSLQLKKSKGDNFHLIDIAEQFYQLSDVLLPDEVNIALKQKYFATLRVFLDEHKIFYEGENSHKDRYNQTHIHLFSENNHWLQAELIEKGLALVAPNSYNMTCIDALFALEDIARRNRYGLWALPEMQIKEATDKHLTRYRAQYQRIKGNIVSIGKTKTTLYLNFGTFWKEDFTVKIPVKRLKKIDIGAKAYNLLSQQKMVGKQIEVRGWLLEDDGALIELHHPKQIRYDFQDNN
jgi:hypothetical protein